MMNIHTDIIYITAPATYETIVTRCEKTIRAIKSFFIPALSVPDSPPYISVITLSPVPYFFFFFFFFFSTFNALLFI
jgi:hypothetical protein